MATITETLKQTKNKNLKDKEKNINEVLKSNNIDEVIKGVRKIDNTCSFSKCKKNIADFAIACKYCSNRFCTTHALPEIHGCGDAVRKDEKQRFAHPEHKVSQDSHAKAADKLARKIKQMEFERKSKQYAGKSKK